MESTQLSSFPASKDFIRDSPCDQLTAPSRLHCSQGLWQHLEPLSLGVAGEPPRNDHSLNYGIRVECADRALAKIHS